MGKINGFLYLHLNEIKAIAYSTFIYLNIDVNIVRVLIWLMLIDTISGIIKNTSLGNRFDFKVLFFGVCSKLMVLLVPMVVALVGKGLSSSYNFIPILDGILKILIISEGLSVITNFYVVKTKKEVKNFDIITLLLSKIRGIFTGFVKSFMKDL